MEKLEEGHRFQGNYILAPIDDITNFKNGRICRGPAWWLVTKDNEVLFFERYSSPQCNNNKEIAERLFALIPKIFPLPCPAVAIKLIEMAYIPYRY